MTEAQCAELLERLDACLHELAVERERRGREPEGGIDSPMRLAILEMKAEALHTVRDALAWRANGGPPSCAACRGEIPRAYLLACPLAVRCRECEEGASSSSWFAAILAAVWTTF